MGDRAAPLGPTVVEVPATSTYELRRTVLRSGTPSTDVVFDGDDEPTTVHLAVVDRPSPPATVLAISTWLARAWPSDPGAPAVQLRGMATAPGRRGAGHGARLLDVGLTLAARRGARYVWANARDTALGFYEAHGFTLDGDGFTDSTTGLPHHRIMRRVPALP